ncbi:unnamed protein product [Allacma fusca]|uniref:Uncharacterized protein n=1 Tax=Allacma fusca TaxID=39272 RepID=A0A8J2KRA6_9HEXA|nr:unnamed protein product [Allacma fusca]
MALVEVDLKPTLAEDTVTSALMSAETVVTSTIAHVESQTDFRNDVLRLLKLVGQSYCLDLIIERINFSHARTVTINVLILLLT